MKFTLVVWSVTRLAIFATFMVVAPHHTLSALGNWDGGWYGSIVQHGYAFAADGGKYNVAFFPLFPLLSWVLFHAGLGWPLAGAVVNNLAFLAAALLLYAFARDGAGERAARWSVVVACLAPLTLFTAVAYAEGLFLFVSALALWSYRRGWYALAGIAAAAAALTRPFGIGLAVALTLAAVYERKGVAASLRCAVGLLGVAAFPIFCAIAFHDPLAFLRAQHGWRIVSGFDAHGWLGLWRGAVGGRPDDILTLFFLFVGLPCVIAIRKLLTAADLLYVILCMITIFFAGPPLSLDRLLYSILPLLFALGILFKRVPTLGYLACAVGAWMLLTDAAAFARFQWVA